MKKLILSALLILAGAASAMAQAEIPPVSQPDEQPLPAQPVSLPPAKYGTVRYDSLLHAMPEYGAVLIRLDQLRQRYAAETAYNETAFKRMFAEFLQGQKDFPQNILLKRQRDLQEAMEKALAFRQEADSLLQQAELEMVNPIRKMLDEAILSVGMERGYECIVNRDANNMPFLHPALTEDATPHIIEKLITIRNH